MAMIRALPEDYNNFVSSLLIMNKLDKDNILQAFQAEENQRRRRSEQDNSSPSDKALAATSHHHSTSANCEFCDRPGHTLPQCFKFKKAQEQAKKPCFTPKDKANSASASPANTQETAGHVSPSPPLLLKH